MRSLHRIVLSLAVFPIAAAPCAAQSGSFGHAVVVGEDELIIAEPNTYFRPGTVYVYRKVDGDWQEAARLRAPAAERADGFGTGLAVTGSTLFVSQKGGRLHIFRKDGGTWQAVDTLAASGLTGSDAECSQYGYCDTDFGIALAADGDWLLVGEPRSPIGGGDRQGRGDDDDQNQARAGVVHVFRRGADGTWTLQARLEPTDGHAGDGFGAAIALADGHALIGAPNWSGAGEATATANEQGGDTGARAGSRPTGARAGGQPTGASADREPTGASAEGEAADASAAGATSSERAGRVYEFRLEDGSWWEVGPLESEVEPNANFGAAIALQGDRAIIGAPGSGDGRGAAFLYRRDPGSGTWSEEMRLAVSTGASGDRFGKAVAIDGPDVWIGSPVDRGNETGIVYLYPGEPDEPLGDAPREIRLTETVTRDAFGDRVVAHGGIAAATAMGMHHQAGAVYVYERGAAGEWRENGMLVSPPDGLEPLLGEERECTDGRVGPFDCADVELLAFIPNSLLRAPGQARGVRTNDNWGWTDPQTGREYALVGRNDGTSFVDITDPVNPVLVGDLPKTPDTPPSQLWRDIKVYENHAFIVADGAGEHGMQVFDLTRLRDVADAPAMFEPDAHYTSVASVHNIAINQETGFAYLVGARGGGQTCGGGLHMVDIREPLNPQFAGCFRDQRGTHDVQCIVYRGPDERYRGREICLMSNADFLAIADVTDKDDPVALSRASSPNPGYMHQGWVTEDHRYFFMDDESDVIQGNVETTRTLIWDLSDLEDPVLAREFMGSMPASAHNLYVKGDLVYQANYRYGLHILDISDPLNPREVGTFDTSPHLSGPGFSGAWSTFPFFDSGTVIVTSLQEGLFVLRKSESEVMF